ncbi:MAG TPA: FliM/FliN family flagellar motor switch protein [Anaerohalosphaeraceae bacterium]|nr:FliM/FliN family flagellar motor switch protein [Anaerohalosphaeraceae bacterium]HOL88488.1 FliM/FliN family flagellar motor switch protein [Anaerohalosphaeraceae bacterium]HPP56510.1 FliM/FliN family flagellar motor switch protein [Anaerohalosphaeraceae bacterium]
MADEQTTSQTAGAQAAVQEAEFAAADGQDIRGGQEHLDMLLDIQLPVTVSLGKAEIPLRRLLQLQPGSILSLEKRIGEPVDLIVQGVPFATGDIVVVEDCYAVRIREILTTAAGINGTAAK